ncbi:hypothetical protein [Pseudomonas sp. LTGT-11-2Z]|uniref:hypothetical protein n=1 Tax=Pseudomonas sp. LTGT-11-2Z TaxID=2479393 RepID=UPI0013CF2015|nr:hypothetical protein [Pseudomonas sp. LTGT-11-2Z]
MNRSFPQDVIIHKDTLANGSCKVSFIHNDTKCPLIELTDERALACNLNQLTIKDFEEQIIPTLQIAIDLIGRENTQQSFELSSKDPTALIVTSLVNSSVVMYSKITTSSELRNKETYIYATSKSI